MSEEKFVIQAGQDLYISNKDGILTKSTLKYIKWPTEPHPETINTALLTIRHFASKRVPDMQVLLSKAPRLSGMYYNFQLVLGDNVKLEISVETVCERLVMDEWPAFERVLLQDLKNAGVNVP